MWWHRKIAGLEGGGRIDTADGAMLADMSLLGNSHAASAALFEPGYWRERGRIEPAQRGRGSAWFIEGPDPWVLKAYRRGGCIARLVADRYVWTGEARVRAFAEWRLLSYLHGHGVRVPQPVAARYRRGWFSYRCDLITRRLPGAVPLSAALAASELPESAWRAVGAAISGMHRLQVDHADLNAHNILIDGSGTVSLIDFDRGALRRGSRWKRRNLERLRRSLDKISVALPPRRFGAAMWTALLAGYGSPL
jgi:3-deoxy-D-manno-octulosonic acid kinase